MFKNIQKQLLLKYPLLWNTKFIPMVCIGVFINLIYFFIGYADGTINFKERYYSNLDFTFFSFSFLISIILIILWLVNYLKNNSFKSFYPKSKNALFYEWIQILIICLLLSAFYFPFEYGRQMHKQSYMNEEIAKKRCETISKGDFFIDGSFAQAEVDSINSVFNDTVIDGTPLYTSIVYKDHVKYFGKKYSAKALINRQVVEFDLSDRTKDSIREVEVRRLLSENKSDEVKKIMQDYLALVKEHQLETNLTLDTWFQITYHFPAFSKYELINPHSPTDKESDITYATTEYDSYNEAQNSETEIKYSKYYIERNTLVHNYQEIAEAYTSSVFVDEAILALLYFAFALSLLIFSFRVTSGKSWLIALVGLGIMNLVFGIFAASFNSFFFYTLPLILSIVAFILYFIRIYRKKSGQKYSKIILNLILWLFGVLIPVIYMTYMEFYKNSIKDVEEYYYDPHYVFLKDFLIDIITINLILVFLSMFFLSRYIRNWKGISEE